MPVPAARPLRVGRAAGAAVAALALGVPLLSVLSAAAPARMVSAAPADRAVVDRPPSSVTLTFDRPPAGSGTHLSVAAPGVAPQAGRPVVRGRQVSIAVPPAGEGTYLVAYHAEFGAGRELAGTIRFDVRGDASPAVAGERPDLPVGIDAAADGHSHGASAEPWVLVLLGADLLVLLVVGLRLLHRRRRDDPRQVSGAPGLH
ncbi:MULTISPECIES: copper resistance CopC family protein [unclassified Micromonospora]|uniref:copper resistance CopC family protein n=1 Tax=unclassified Micromonospora TaxID=2617518 RepID=UPI001C21E799|nr:MULTISPECIES: copper resistance CopC family protein [unclassified Micromonospora]MBU8860280.1 copper resistance protein CopC [Micromonospora sp. WMMB482]MDM4779814.1 copper resistance protein CopC [Micromonospora sp. b486]